MPHACLHEPVLWTAPPLTECRLGQLVPQVQTTTARHCQPVGGNLPQSQREKLALVRCVSSVAPATRLPGSPFPTCDFGTTAGFRTKFLPHMSLPGAVHHTQ